MSLSPVVRDGFKNTPGLSSTGQNLLAAARRCTSSDLSNPKTWKEVLVQISMVQGFSSRVVELLTMVRAGRIVDSRVDIARVGAT